VIPVSLYKGRTVGIFGLARSGVSAARALSAGGAAVLAWDDTERGRQSAAANGISLIDASTWPWERLAALILSPGVPLTHPEPHEVVKAAKAHDVPVIGDIELFYRTLKPSVEAAPAGSSPSIVCVTGTNGKSTATALIGHLLSRAGFDAQVGGNIGKPALDLTPPTKSTVYVLEVSSYQIDLAPSLKPDVGVLTNITPDHLDRHGSLEHYAGVKRRLFEQQRAGDVAVVGVDDKLSADTCTLLSARGGVNVVPISVGKVLGRGVYVIDGLLYDGLVSPPLLVSNLKDCQNLPGVHNWQNAAVSYAAVRGIIRDVGEIARALLSFPGLPHRLENVGKIGKVQFINDSKATNADAAGKALACYSNIYWIAGGQAKDGGIEALRPFFPRIAKAYLIGAAADTFAQTLEGEVKLDRAGDLKTAMIRALADAVRSPQPNPVVLLSPACASFDQFRDYEDRGNSFRAHFQDIATQLNGHEARA
jgi:UDP-N-acetylmuramoylalanine--D-glutamate ligase